MVSMRLLTAALLALVLLGWGGLPATAAFAAAERGHASAERLPDCAEAHAHHGHAGHVHAGHVHADHGAADRGDRPAPDDGGTGPAHHHGCCAAACGPAGLAPADGHGAGLPRPRGGVLATGDEALRERPVSPLRRPPKPEA
jgi:hypothetical protein